ncbi:hypothetical protein GQ54DRAFT_319272 [Martensiomyces pterosporus]|nr:hypothetical protein GQ54DRAFT_319272 [Martensiomyces pterosporus]
MELPHIGSNCALDGCAKLDFLPVSCSYCRQRFCSEHGNPHAHHCASIPTESNPPASAAINSTPISAYTRPARTGPKDIPPETKKTLAPEQIAALQAIKQTQDKKSQSSEESASSPKPKKQPKISPRVELMRLKGKAAGNPSMAMSDRLYLCVKSQKKSMAVFVNKNAVIGNAASQFARQMGLSVRPDKAYHLQVEGTGEALPSNRKFDDILSIRSDTTFYNGCTVCLQ